LKQDLGHAPDAEFDEVSQLDIVKAFVRERFDKVSGTREVRPLSSGRKVWVLARGHDHRGGTFYDDEERVVWLLAYRLHRSDTKEDFFPYCKELDAQDALLPTPDDYEALFRERDARFAFAVRIEAPLILKAAREGEQEHRVMLGGEYGACIAVEVAGELESTTVAFRVDTVLYDHVAMILAAFHDGSWDEVSTMPSRDLEPYEVAFEHLRETPP
jgi:hypothetical protein